MARTTKRGTCELCGASANVGMNHGSKVCPQCTHVQSALNKRIESVAAAARSMGKTEELLGHLIPDGRLAVKVTADLLREISGIVGYEGEDPAELVAAVRRRVLTCASCEAEDVLHEIREIVGYTPEQGDKGLADAVRAFADRRPAEVPDDCTELREDLDRSTRVIEELRAELQEALDSDELFENEIYRAKNAIARLRDELTLAQQARDEWEQRAVQAEANVQDQAAELNADDTRLRDELTRTGAEVEGLRGDLDRSTRLITELRDKLQETQSGLLWYRVTVDGIKEKLGMGADDDFGEAPEQIASMMHAFGRFQQMAENEAKRADLLQDDPARRDAIIARLRDQVAATDESLAEQELWKPEPAPTVPASTWADESLLADFGRRVLRGEVAVQFLGLRP